MLDFGCSFDLGAYIVSSLRIGAGSGSSQIIPTALASAVSGGRRAALSTAAAGKSSRTTNPAPLHDNPHDDAAPVKAAAASAEVVAAVLSKVLFADGGAHVQPATTASASASTRSSTATADEAAPLDGQRGRDLAVTSGSQSSPAINPVFLNPSSLRCSNRSAPCPIASGPGGWLGLAALTIGSATEALEVRTGTQLTGFASASTASGLGGGGEAQAFAMFGAEYALGLDEMFVKKTRFPSTSTTSSDSSTTASGGASGLDNIALPLLVPNPSVGAAPLQARAGPAAPART